METKLKIPFIFFAGVIEYLTLRIWFVCKNFTDILHHTSINLSLQIKASVASEKGTSLLLTRVFNNKFVASIINLLRFYLQFWDIRFGANWFSLIGYFGILAGFYYILSCKKKSPYHWLTLVLILILPWIEILIEPHISLKLKSMYLWLPFCIFSLYGMYQFLSHGTFKKRIIVFSLLILLSIWWMAFMPYGISRYCM